MTVCIIDIPLEQRRLIFPHHTKGSNYGIMEQRREEMVFCSYIGQTLTRIDH